MYVFTVWRFSTEWRSCLAANSIDSFPTNRRHRPLAGWLVGVRVFRQQHDAGRPWHERLTKLQFPTFLQTSRTFFFFLDGKFSFCYIFFFFILNSGRRFYSILLLLFFTLLLLLYFSHSIQLSNIMKKMCLTQPYENIENKKLWKLEKRISMYKFEFK